MSEKMTDAMGLHRRYDVRFVDLFAPDNDRLKDSD